MEKIIQDKEILKNILKSEFDIDISEEIYHKITLEKALKTYEEFYSLLEQLDLAKQINLKESNLTKRLKTNLSITSFDNF